LRVWCNPPYCRNKLPLWVEKCAKSGAEVVVALLPARTDTRWFHKFIYQKKNVEVRFIKGRIAFSGEKSTGTFPSIIVIFRNNKPGDGARTMLYAPVGVKGGAK
jgi:DNA N-6-adenine-methyltransferase (Dam)